MKIWILKRRGKNWIGNMPLSSELSNKFYADYCFYRKKDAIEYLKKYDGKYGNPFVVWEATMKCDKTDNRVYHVR
jgi:hypothetical protein